MHTCKKLAAPICVSVAILRTRQFTIIVYVGNYYDKCTHSNDYSAHLYSSYTIYLQLLFPVDVH